MLVQALGRVYQKPRYVMLALGVSMAVFMFVVWFPNIRLIISIIISTDVPFAAKFELPFSLLGSIATNFTFLSASYMIAMAVLLGMYTGMMVYFLKHRIKEVGKEIGRRGAVAGSLGIMSGVLGLGCAACGSLFLTSLSFVGVSGVLALLPFRGSEFGIIGVVLLAFAIYAIAKQIENPLVCKFQNYKDNQ